MKNFFALDRSKRETETSAQPTGSNRPAAKPFYRRPLAWILFLALVAAAGGGYYLFRTYVRPAAAPQAAAAALQTAVARRGNLVVSASAAGKVVAADQISLGFDENGTLADLRVKVGDQVQAGQVLARLQTDQTEEEIALAKAEAELNVLTAQQALADLNTNAQVDAAQALKDIEDAGQALAELQNNDLRLAEAAQALAQAQTAVKDAERLYNSVRSTADKNSIDAAYAEMVLKKSQLADIQEKFKAYARKPDTDLEKANLQLKLSAAQQAYNSAVGYYNALTGTGSPLDLEQTSADLEAARAQLEQAQNDWEKAQAGPSPGEIALAEAQLAVAEKKHETLKNGTDPTRQAQADAELASAKAKLAVAQQDQAALELTAPRAGTILSIEGNVGEALNSGPFITLADLSQPMLEIYLDETDLDKAVVGFESDVVFDALPDTTFTGHIVEVNPSLVTVSNVAAVVAKVQLDSDSYAKPNSLPVGSNASVEVIGGRAENAVLVPVEALREIDKGEYALFVQENGKLRLRVVTVGLMDYTSAEITSGLSGGEIVTTGQVQTGQSSAGAAQP